MELMTTEKTGNLSTWAADINAAHADAVKHATSAIGYAKTAGDLLLKAKQKLPHGAFGGWLEANVTVSERQARRYMAAAQGKPLPMRAVKSDTVSVLPYEPKETSWFTEEDRGQVAVILNDLTRTRNNLEINIRAVTISRDALIEEGEQMRRQIYMQNREIDRLKKAA